MLSSVLPSFSCGPRSGAECAPHGTPALPLGSVEPRPASTAVHSIRPVDTDGREVDKAIVAALGRHPRDLLSWRVTGGLVRITRPGHGTRDVTEYGHISVPAVIGRRAGIGIRDRILPAADIYCLPGCGGR